MSMGMGISCPSLGITAFLLHEIGRGMLEPLTNTYVGRNTPHYIKATVLSCHSVVEQVFGVAGLVFWGRFTERSSIPTTWVCIGVFLVLSAVALTFIRERK